MDRLMVSMSRLGGLEVLEGECECEIFISHSYKVGERRYDRLCPSTFEGDR
jgi:hypothetical protein